MTTITKRFFLSTLTGAAMLALGATAALAGEPLKIGMVLPMSGPFASYGKQIESGARLYLAQSGGTFSGRKVELIIKDDTGVAPEISKRAAQELVVKDKVDILAGFGLTPSAFAVAPIATEAKKPMIVMNAATSAITTKSEYILRVSHTLPQVTAPIASWAAKNKIKKVFTLVADFGPGLDAAAQFKKTFTAAGGEVVGEVRTPVKSPDFAPFLQKIKDAAPEAVFLFVPPGEQTIAFIKGFAERDLAKAGIRIIATGDLSDEDILDSLGDGALGVVTSHHYSTYHPSAVNKKFVEAFQKANKGMRPNFMAVGGYDGMRVIYEALKVTKGNGGGDALLAAMKGQIFESPRGPMFIDAQTRDVVQNIYLRKVERKDGQLYNVEFDVIKDVKDPGKAR